MTLAEGVREVSLRTLNHYTADGLSTLCGRRSFIRPPIEAARICRRCEELEAEIWLWQLPELPAMPPAPGTTVAIIIPKPSR